MDQSIAFHYPSILKDEAQNKALAEKGYAVFPFLKPDTVEQLASYYLEFQKEEPSHFYSSTHSADMAFRKKTSDFINAILSPLVPDVLVDYKLLGGAYVVKPAHGKGILQPHQDWNLVDERKSRSYNLWIPLVDVDVKNGAVFVLAGSHARLNTYRGPGIPSVFKEVEQHIWQKLEPLPMKAGEALFYDHALLHGSPANTSDRVRIGIVCGVIPKDVAMQLHALQDGKIETFQCDESFFLEKDPIKDVHQLQKLNNHSPNARTLSMEDFNSLFFPEPVKHTLFQKLLNLFK
jgi:hypothetical protein